jgi:AcrR family transcriptional regulator
MQELSDVDKNILKAAEQEFCLHGFHETVVKDIASRADVGKGTVYRHFGNKNQLFGSLIERSTKELRSQLAEVIDVSKPTEAILKDITDVHFEFFETKRHLVEIIIKEGLEQTGDEINTVIDEWEQYRSLIEDVFDKGLEENPDWSLEDPVVGTRLYTSWIWGYFRDRIVFGEDADSDTYRNRLHELFIGGLKHGA